MLYTSGVSCQINDHNTLTLRLPNVKAGQNTSLPLLYRGLSTTTLMHHLLASQQLSLSTKPAFLHRIHTEPDGRA